MTGNEEFLISASEGLERAAVMDIQTEVGKMGVEHKLGDTKTAESVDGAGHGAVKDSASSAGSIQNFTKEQADSDHQSAESKDVERNGPPLKRFQTGILSPRLEQHRRKILHMFLRINALLGAFCIAVLSIYWGATYNRDHYMFKVSVLSVIQDESDLVPLTIAHELPALISEVPCTWHIYSQNEFMSKYNVTAGQISNKVRDLVFEEKYWMALNAKPNATNDLYQSLSSNTKDFTPAAYYDVWYMSGRDPSSVKSSILPNMQALESLYANYFQTQYLPQLVSNVTSSGNASSILPDVLIQVSNMEFSYIDYRPFYDQVLLSALQVGLIYCLLLTFFQLSLFGPLHAEIAQFLRPKQMIFYRICISWLTYFILSLFFCTVSAVFQVDFTLTFGKGGFIVYWLSTCLLMMALGGANENMISLIFSFGPQYLGFWLMGWIVLNISCSFYPMVLNNEFYRYGYAMPIHNGADIFKVIFLNLSKHKMGRNYGILIAWVAINTALFPFVMKIVGQRMKKQREQAAAAATAAAIASANEQKS